MKVPFLFLFIISWFSAFNQAPTRNYNASDFGNEQIVVQVNSTFLMTGETLYFKIFCQLRKNKKPTMLSKVAYLELIDEQGTPVFQTMVSLQKGNGHGDCFIRSTFSSGNYTLIAYTQWMKNFTTNSFFTNRITIVNPFNLSTTEATDTNKKIPRKDIPIGSQSNDVQLKLSEKEFKRREKVSVTLTGRNTASVCVSVRKKEATLDDAGSILLRPMAGVGGDSTRSDDSVSASPFSARKDLPSLDAKTYLPEIRGHLITGRLIANDEVPSKRNILASIPGLNFVFRATTTDQNGNFVMIVDRLPESSTMIFQILDDDINNYTLKIEDSFLHDYSKFQQATLLLDTGLRAIIDERNVYTQIENAYYVAKANALPATPPTSFYNLPDKIYRLDDFTRFPTMEDIFREYVHEVFLKRSRGTFSLHVVSHSGYPHQKEPLILIDGVAILNTNTLMTYDPLKIERIEIVRDKYFYGSLDFDGIVSLKTYKGAVEDLPSLHSHRENIVKIQAGEVYSFPDYLVDKLKLERVPDYRLQLYWNPDVTVTNDHNTTVDFYTSDVTGNYEIIVEGFSSDGELVSTREVFSVLK
jgi:hypothetical protein